MRIMTTTQTIMTATAAVRGRLADRSGWRDWWYFVAAMRHPRRILE
jgi:hypothetical protein